MSHIFSLYPSTCFRGQPTYASREIIVIMGNLSSIDPGNIFSTFEVPSISLDYHPVYRSVYHPVCLDSEEKHDSVLGYRASC